MPWREAWIIAAVFVALIIVFVGIIIWIAMGGAWYEVPCECNGSWMES